MTGPDVLPIKHIMAPIDAAALSVALCGFGNSAMRTEFSGENHLTHRIGESRVVERLEQLGFTTESIYVGNEPRVRVSKYGQEIEVWIKVKRRGAWQFDARKFLRITERHNLQVRKTRSPLPNPALLCILVSLATPGPAQFYILGIRDLQKTVWEEYKLQRRPGVYHHAVWPTQVTEFLNNWTLFPGIGETDPQ